MVIKTTSTAYDNDGNEISSYQNEKVFNAEDVEGVIKKFKKQHEKCGDTETREMPKEEACQCDEACCEAEGDFDDEDGIDVIGIEISIDTLKKAALIAGGLVGLRILRKLAKVVL